MNRGATSADSLPPELAERLRELSPENRALLERKLRDCRFAPDPKPPLRPRANPATAPLSFAQERLRFLWELEPESPAYNRPTFLQLTGSLDVGALEQALNELPRRHEVLRASYPIADGRPVVALRPWEPQALPGKDLSGVPAERQQAELKHLARLIARQPFDLAKGPVMRATLVRCGPAEHFLLLVFHHIAFDAWSGTVLLDELPRLYEAYRRSAPSPLDPLPIQYADFASWQRECQAAQAWGSDWNYWRQELAGELPALELPLANSRPAVPRFDGETVLEELPAELVAGLRELSQREGATLFMVLLAALKVLLRRYTGQEDLIVGCPIAGRTEVATERLIGCFVNTLALRSRVSGEMKFRELLGQVRDTLFRALDHQALPFEQVIEAVNPTRVQNRTPIFQVFFNYRNLPAPSSPASALRFTPWRGDEGIAQFDLTLDLTEAAEGTECRWIFDRDIFRRDDIQRLAGHYRTLLGHLAIEPDCPVSEVPMLTSVEERQLLVEWNPTAMPCPQEKCVHELFEAQAAGTPDAVAVVFEGQRLTYREANERANHLAARLRAVGVRPEVLVGICLDRSLEMIVGLLAILKAGGAYVPLDPAYPKARLAFMIEEGHLQVLLTQRRLLTAIPSASTRVVCLEDLLGQAQPTSARLPWPKPEPANLAYVIFTSGSTGRPKGVEISHGAVTNLLTSMRRQPGLTSDDILLAITTLSFDIAVLEIFLPLTTGATLVLASRETAMDAKRLARLLDQCRATVMQATPTTWRSLLEAGWHGNPRLKMLVGGEACPRQLANALISRGAAVWNMYGPTETTVWSAIGRIEAGDGPVPIGRPIANTQVYIVDPNQRPVPIGVPGELLVGGHGLARGYLGQPDLTAQKFILDPFAARPGGRVFKTGDRARYRSDGCLECLGRLDLQLKVRGFRIEPGEIEAALRQHPAVSEAVVLAREGPSGTQQLAAYLVSRRERSPTGPACANAAPTARELREHLRTLFPDYMVPSVFVLLPVLPQTPNGKIDRQALGAVLPPASPAGDPTPPGTPAEETLAALWRELLRLERVGIHDNFFELGGHSLLAMRLMWDIQKRFGSALPLAALFSAPTIAELARLLAEPGSAVAVTPSGGLRGTGTGAPVFHIPGAAGYEFLPEPIARRIGTVRRFYDGLQFPGLDGRQPPLARLEDIARDLVRQIRRVAPGPYCLSGYSWGGVVAFEVARQMEAAGLEVELLLLLDAYCPAGPVPKRSGAELLAAFRDLLSTRDLQARARWLARFLAAKLAIRRSLAMGKLKALGRAFAPAIPRATPTEKAAAARVEQAARAAARQYRPGNYAGKAIVFQVEFWNFAYLFQARDPLNGWGRVIRGELKVVTIPGVHEFVLKEPNVSALAEKVRGCILSPGAPMPAAVN